MPSICPSVVENIFALAVALQIHRRHANQSAGMFYCYMKWLPTSVIANTAASFQSVEKGVASERVVDTAAIRAVIPVRGVYFRNAVANFGSGCQQDVLINVSRENFTCGEGKKE